MSDVPAIGDIWQIGSGNADRCYADTFLKYGVALVGPGDPGPWSAERGDDEYEGPFVRYLAQDLKKGDVLVLRKGMYRLCAIGVVANDDYIYLEQFDDLNGWDLQHARRVRWFPLPEEVEITDLAFTQKRLTRAGDRVAALVRPFLSTPPLSWPSWHVSPLPALPPLELALETVPPPLRGIVMELEGLYPLFWSTDSFGDHPSEDELIVHVIVPLLRALGWPAELVAVKWRYADIAVFRTLPRSPENCAFVIEAKRLGSGDQAALVQAMGYADGLGLSKADIVVTDGVRYSLHSRDHGFARTAYANLIRPKEGSKVLFDRMVYKPTEYGART